MWWRVLTALFLVLHGVLFAFLDPESWLVDDGRGLPIALGIVAALMLCGIADVSGDAASRRAV
jgi:hypothetical protein